MTARIAAALIDLSGTLHIEDAMIPGAIEALQRYLYTLCIVHMYMVTAAQDVM